MAGGNPRCEHCGWVYGQPHYTAPYPPQPMPVWVGAPAPDPDDDYSI